jgi:hypothetical protein
LGDVDNNNAFFAKQIVMTRQACSGHTRCRAMPRPEGGQEHRCRQGAHHFLVDELQPSLFGRAVRADRSQAEANITQKNTTPEQAAEEAVGRIKTIFERFKIV